MSISALIGFTFWSPSSPDHARSLLNEAVLWLQLWRLFAALDPARQVTFTSLTSFFLSSLPFFQHLDHQLMSPRPPPTSSPLVIIHIMTSLSMVTIEFIYLHTIATLPTIETTITITALSQELEETSSSVHGQLVPKRGRWWSPLARLVLMMRSF